MAPASGMGTLCLSSLRTPFSWRRGEPRAPDRCWCCKCNVSVDFSKGECWMDACCQPPFLPAALSVVPAAEQPAPSLASPCVSSSGCGLMGITPFNKLVNLSVPGAGGTLREQVSSQGVRSSLPAWRRGGPQVGAVSWDGGLNLHTLVLSGGGLPRLSPSRNWVWKLKELFVNKGMKVIAEPNPRGLPLIPSGRGQIQLRPAPGARVPSGEVRPLL